MTEQVQVPLQNCKAPADHLLKVVDLGPPQQPLKKTDGNTAFLRAARSGNLEKVLEFINANVDINSSNSNGLNALHLAAKDGHVEVAAELLKRGANVDAATKKGNTALHIASLAGQEEVVKLLIEHGASVNAQSQNSGFTPLYMAAQENHERVVRYLLNNGANQSLATEDGFTPLAVAMQQGHDKVVTELLENDTRGKIRLPALHIAAKKDDCKAAALLLQSEHNPDITSKSGFTPLHIASHYGNDAIANLLLAKGADVNYAAKHNITPLHVAAKWGRNNMVILLLEKGASIIAKTRDGLTPLHCAARSGHEEVVDTLLQKHAPITAKTKNGLAPLHMASQGDHVEAARVLLTHRAPVDDVTVDYLTALHVASHCGHVSVAKLLLDRKADPNARALNGFTPLHIACKKNRVKIVELLLKHGGCIEATTESGLSPLHVASFMGCMNIVIFLLQCGANPDVSTIRGETPLHLASRANQTDIIRVLLRNGSQVDAKAREHQTPLHIAARLGNTDIVMLLLQHGASVDSTTKDLYTSLHIAAKENQEEVAQVLLENNASMTAVSKKGFTPLHLGAKYGRTSIAKLFLQRGAPVDAQGKNGVTPLHVASHYDHQSIALLLLDKGASPHATAKNGHTPLHIAARKNQMDIAAMLLEYGANAGAESKAGFTPLHLSAQEGHVDMTNLLLEHKADVNHSSKNGLSPLHLCAQEDCVDVATILVANGADVNAVTKAGYTPLHIASHFGQFNMVRFLLTNKAKVDTTTSTGYTPLHQAAQQGNSAIVAVLLDSGASPDNKNSQGQTALCIAQKLGYISVVEVLKNVTDSSKGGPTATSGEEKYKVVAPETMQENFMSDSEDEGGDDATNEQSYRYLTIDEMKSLGDDSLPIDVSKEDRYDTTAGVDESISPQHTFSQLNAAPVIDNIDVTRVPVVQTGFLVSFLVDAKGGAMRGCRHSGVRVIVPPQCVTMPTRVTCRYVRRDKPNHPPPPPLMEGEALASRILELGPVGVKFLGPVVIEVPNFAALRGNEREIVILRSDNGETWREHTVDSSTEAVHDILSRSFDKDGNHIQLDEPGRITSIVTNDFPHYFAIVSRIRQEVHAIGPEGGMVSSSVVPQVQAVFPQGALTKKIKVGLQAQPIPSELTAAVLGNCVAVSPIVTIEPRRRKFHKPITLTLPVPQAANKGMINQYSGDAPTLRLLCSITGGTSRAQWEDVTGSTPLTFVKECVSFTTTVSARFWLMDIRDIAVATKKATELYREAILIPFMAKFVVFAKRIDNNEARLRVFCMTDDKEDKTLESQEQFTEVAKSRDVEVLEGKKQLIELSGNLISVTKSGDQLKLGFNAFQENRLPFTVRIKDNLADPIGRMLFFKEQKPVKTSTPQPPICVLNIVLPDTIIPDSDFSNSPIRRYYLLNDAQGYHRSELKFSDISNLIGEDWVALAEKLGIRSPECKVIKTEHPESTARQSLVMLKQWHQRTGNKATANILESALLNIGREDIVQECFINAAQSKKLPSENGLISHRIEDFHRNKKDVHSTDDDERKYTAEEKIVDDSEIKKSVSERKMEIEQRLLSEKRDSLKERSDSEERRLPKDLNLSRQLSEEKELAKNAVHEETETFEPAKLTFQQKRLSFEKGYSVDKILAEGNNIRKETKAFIEEEKLQKDKSAEKEKPQKEKTPPKKEPEQKEVSVEKSVKKDKSEEKIPVPVQKDKSSEKVNAKSVKKDKSMEDVKQPLKKDKSGEKVNEKSAKGKSKEPEKPIKKDKPAEPEKPVKKDEPVEESVKDKAAKGKPEKPVEESVCEKPVKKDSVEEKSLKKDKSDEKIQPKQKSEEKVSKIPVPVEEKVIEKTVKKEIFVQEKVIEKPARQQSTEKTKKDKSPEPVKENVTDNQKAETVKEEEKRLSFQEKRLSFEQGTVIPSTEVKVQNEKAEETATERKVDDARRDSELFEGVTLGLGKLDAKPISSDQNFLSPKPLKTPPPSPAEFKDGGDEWQKTDSSDIVKSEKSVSAVETSVMANQLAKSIESAESTSLVSVVNNVETVKEIEHLPELKSNIEVLKTEVVELEDAVSLANQDVMVSDYQDKTDKDKYTDILIDMLIEQETAQLVASGGIYDSESEDENQINGQKAEQSDENNERLISDPETEGDLRKYLNMGSKNDHAPDHGERSPQRKVAFRLNSDENELVYPGETDSEETSGSDNNDDVVEFVENHTESEKPVNSHPTEVERKFERMASDSLDESEVAEGEFHRIVSQLSFEEVTDCLNAWDETESAAKRDVGDNPVRLEEGDKQLDNESDMRPPSQILSDSDTQDNMDYFSKKKFWQSMDSSGSEKSTPTPVPKPRASISAPGGQTADETPTAAKRSIENIRAGFAISKSESLKESFYEHSRPSMKKVHSLTSYSTDSEAEYIANYGIEKLAYENVGFCEEDESPVDAGKDVIGVKAKKMFFEQMRKDSSQDSVTSQKSLKDEKVKISKDSSQESITSPVTKKDDKFIQLRESGQDCITSSTTHAEEIVEIQKKSSMTGITKLSSEKNEIITIQKESSLDRVTDLSSKEEEPVKVQKDSRLESITSQSSKTDESIKVQKDSSLESITKQSSKKDEIVEIQKDSSNDNVTNLSSKKEEPIKIQKDSSLESVTSQSSKKTDAVKIQKDFGLENVTITSSKKEEPINIRKDSILESITSQSSKKDDVVKIQKDSSLEKVTNVSSKNEEPINIRKDSSLESITSQSSKKDDVEKIQKDFGIENIATTSSKKEELIKIQKDSILEIITSQSSKKDDAVNVKKDSSSIISVSPQNDELVKIPTISSQNDEIVKIRKDSSLENVTAQPLKKDAVVSMQKDLCLGSVTSLSSPKDEIVKIQKDTSLKSVTSQSFRKDEPIIIQKDSILDNATNLLFEKEDTIKIQKDSSLDSVASLSSKKDELIKIQNDCSLESIRRLSFKKEEPIKIQKDSSLDSVSSLSSNKDEPIKIQTDSSLYHLPKLSSKTDEIIKIQKDSSLDSVASISSQKDEIAKVQKDLSRESITSLSSKKDEELEIRKDSSEDSITSVSSEKDEKTSSKSIPSLETKSGTKTPVSKVTKNSRTNGSLDDSIDSTISESDITPEDLRDKQFFMQDWENANEILENVISDKAETFQMTSTVDVTRDPHRSDIIVGMTEALKDEVKLAAANLINEIETELGKRTDLAESLSKKQDDLGDDATSSNDITDEDLRSTGTEVDIPVLYGPDESGTPVDLEPPMKMKISEALPTEYEINYEQVEEFNVLESDDYEEQIISEEAENELKTTGEFCPTVKDSPKPSRIPIFSGKSNDMKSPPENLHRKSSEDDKSRTSLSPEIEIRQIRTRKSNADFDPCSSSSESHYQSVEQSTASRPCSSDVEALLSGTLPGTTGSSEYETAASHDTSHDFHTAMSSASLHESIKSIDSESSGNLGSAEASSEVSETLCASTAELEHDLDIAAANYYDENKRSVFRREPREPYDNEIPMDVIRGVGHSLDLGQLQFAYEGKLEPSLSGPIYGDRKSKEEELREIDEKLLSSSEDVSTSCFSLTDGGSTLQTVIEVNNTESDRMDNSLISEKSLTTSATSNQFSTSSSDLKDEIELDKKTVDTNTTVQAHEQSSSVTIITSTCQDHGRPSVCTQVTSKIDKSDSKDTLSQVSFDEEKTVPSITISHHPHSPESKEAPPVSPDSESFELIEHPDLIDDFVVIEEVAKEALEQDREGKSILITEKRKTAVYDDDDDDAHVIPSKTSSTLTKVEYYGGTDGCDFHIEGVPSNEKPCIDEEYEKSPPNDGEMYEHEVEEGKKWIEMQFQADNEDASSYEYSYERVVLEDIKEEDTDDMQSSKMGSVSSQISQSIGSLGSMKQSLSSTPDYDVLAGKRYFTKSSDKDDVSQGSLQEFERLEQLMALESMKSKLSGSQDSLGSSANGKKRSGDDVSVSSLKEFEGLEYACVEVEKIEERVQAEERLLSQIEEGHESQASESESCETLEKSCYESDDEGDYEQKMFEIDEIIRQAQSNVEQFVDVDRLERTESLGRGDSFEETARIPDFELDQPLTEILPNTYCGKKYIDIDISQSLTASTDSLERSKKGAHSFKSDSLEPDRMSSPRSVCDIDEELPVTLGSDRSSSEKGDDDQSKSPRRLMLSSPDSLGGTSSAGTHATYHNETDSLMSSSCTSAGSNTMISSTENLENIVTNYSNWLDSNPYVTEVAYNVTEKSYVTTERVTETPSGVKVTYHGEDAKKLYEKELADFKPGEFYTETREVDADGNVRIKKVMESRAIVTSEKVQNVEKIILKPEEYRSETVSHTVAQSSEGTYQTLTEINVRQEKKETSEEKSTDETKS